MIQLLRGTQQQLNSYSTIIPDGQPVFEKDTGQLKIGNGTSMYSALPYVGASGSTNPFDSWQSSSCMVPGYLPDTVASYIDLSPHLRWHFGDVATSENGNCDATITTSWNAYGQGWQYATYRIKRRTDNKLLTEIDSLGNVVWTAVAGIRVPNDGIFHLGTWGDLYIDRPTHGGTWNSNTSITFQYMMLTTDIAPN